MTKETAIKLFEQK